MDWHPSRPDYVVKAFKNLYEHSRRYSSPKVFIGVSDIDTGDQHRKKKWEFYLFRVLCLNFIGMANTRTAWLLGLIFLRLKRQLWQYCKFTNGVVDNGAKFITGADTDSKFKAGVINKGKVYHWFLWH